MVCFGSTLLRMALLCRLRQNHSIGQRESTQERLFYSFNLEDHIPANHLLRSIDQCLHLSGLRHYLADFYSPIGRPSIDPELMIRMLIVGYCYGIRSELRLCEEALFQNFHCGSNSDHKPLRPMPAINVP